MSQYQSKINNRRKQNIIETQYKQSSIYFDPLILAILSVLSHILSASKTLMLINHVIKFDDKKWRICRHNHNNSQFRMFSKWECLKWSWKFIVHLCHFQTFIIKVSNKPNWGNENVTNLLNSIKYRQSVAIVLDENIH